MSLRNFMLNRELLNFTFFILIFLSITDFFIFLSPMVFAAFFILFLFIAFCNIIRFGGGVNFFLLMYIVISLVLFSINYIADSGFNMVLFIPLIAYCFVFSFRSFSLDSLDKAVKFIVWLFLLVSVVEIMVKLNFMDFPLYKEFLKSYGDMRPDVLRVRTLFGSSLSTAALTIFLSFYFLFVKKSYFYIFLVVIVIMLSGSRTSFVLFSFFFLSAFFLSRNMFLYSLKLKPIYVFLLSVSVVFLVSAIYLAFEIGIGHIISRTFSVKADESFAGREDTTAATFYRLFDEMPASIFFGVDSAFLSDSAFISIAAVSGVLALIMYVALFFYLLVTSRFSRAATLVYSVVFFLGGAVIGDFLVPAVSLLYFVTFLVLIRDKMEGSNESRSCHRIT